MLYLYEKTAGVHYKADSWFHHESLEWVRNVSWVAFCGKPEPKPSLVTIFNIKWVRISTRIRGSQRVFPSSHFLSPPSLFNRHEFSIRPRWGTTLVIPGTPCIMTECYEYWNMPSKCYQMQIFSDISDAEWEGSRWRAHNKQKAQLDNSRKVMTSPAGRQTRKQINSIVFLYLEAHGAAWNPPLRAAAAVWPAQSCQRVTLAYISKQENAKTPLNISTEYG